ncbi:MAG: hypothetical protein WA791_21810 [Rhodomicrobium sp.]
MQIFIDESGSFAGFHPGSISVVGALAIPDGKLEFLTKKFSKAKTHFPLEKGETKGRLLDEQQIDQVVTLLARNEVIFETTAIDLGIQTEEEINAYKLQHGQEMLAKVSNFRESQRAEVKQAAEEILTTSVPLYLQALTTFDVIHRLIGNMSNYYSQRRPAELGAIAWVVDGKDPQKVTKWERWWSHYARGALATMSIRRPSLRLPIGDFSYFDKKYAALGDDGEPGTDAKALLENIRFSTEIESGLEFIDILSNAIRRTLTGNLQQEGWCNIRKTLIHRNEDAYVHFVLFRDGPDLVQHASYEKAVHDGFTSGGKPMLTPCNTRWAVETSAEQS